MAENEEKVGETTEEEQTETPEETQEEASSASDDLRREFEALKSQFERSHSENESLRESLRLQSRLLDERTSGNKKQELPKELEELKRVGLVFGDDVQESLKPITGTVAKLYDQTDAVNFQLALQREDPELLQGENFDRVNQAIESVRQRAAREGGTWLSRMDAYLYAKGAGMLKGKAKPAAKQASVEERKQASERKQAQASNTSETRRTSGPSAEISKIREKASRGERLTAEERAKYRDFIGETSF